MVLDAATGKPLAGARVSPRYFGHPLVWVDTERAVKTDGKGRFELGGVDKGFGVCVECEGYESIGDWREFEAKMQLDTDGGENTFRLPRSVPRKTAGGHETEREVKPRLFGSVVDERGEPVGPYRVVAAAMQDPDSLFGNKEYYFGEEISGVPAGEAWELTLYSDAKLYWVMAQAQGLAPAMRVVRHEELAQPIHLQLRRGFSLTGQVEGPGVAQGKAVAMLQPMYLFDSNPPHKHHDQSPLHGVGASRANVGSDGRFGFDHLSTGSYLLQIAAPAASPIERLITFRDRDVRLAEPLKMPAAGRIEGVVYNREGELMVMEPCHWSPPETIDPKVGEALWGKYTFVGGLGRFTTDERGRFVLENVPAGHTSVGFSYNVLIDVIDSHDHVVNVLPGRTTEVRINAPEGSESCWQLPVEVVVGDGSRQAVMAGCSITNPKFLDPPEGDDPQEVGIALAFQPLPGQAVSWPGERVGAFVVIPLSGPGRAAADGYSPRQVSSDKVGVGMHFLR